MVLAAGPFGIAVAQPPTQAQGTAPLPDFPLSSVATGMTGYALTAGPGDVIERFPVEVVSVQFDAVPGLDLVLIRVSGPFIEASGGVAAGMSGSPVYLVEGARPALLGAIGYVFPDADHHLALVTPIAAMRDELAGGGPPASVDVPGYGRAVPVASHRCSATAPSPPSPSRQGERVSPRRPTSRWSRAPR